MKIPRTCIECNNNFNAFSFSVKNGKGNFCSYSCSAKFTNKKLFKSEQERFLLKISTKIFHNKCWIWEAAKDKDGYGIFSSSYGKLHRVTRYIWELFNNVKIKKGMIVCHKCDNPICVNPDHLFIGTTKDNIMDMYLKGRAPNKKGSNSPVSKLNENQVLTIKKKLKENINARILCKEFNVSLGCIRHIEYGNTWKHLL